MALGVEVGAGVDASDCTVVDVSADDDNFVALCSSLSTDALADSCSTSLDDVELVDDTVAALVDVAGTTFSWSTDDEWVAGAASELDDGD